MQRVVLDGDRVIRIGRTELRIRGSDYVLPRERALTGSPELIPIIVVLSVLLVAVNALSLWLRQVTEPRLSYYLPTLLGLPAYALAGRDLGGAVPRLLRSCALRAPASHRTVRLFDLHALPATRRLRSLRDLVVRTGKIHIRRELCLAGRDLLRASARDRAVAAQDSKAASSPASPSRQSPRSGLCNPRRNSTTASRTRLAICCPPPSASSHTATRRRSSAMSKN